MVLARALCTRLTATLGALEAGRIDAVRARTMAEHTADLTDRQARKVEAVVLDGLPAQVLDGTGTVGPWDGPTPERFTRRVSTAVAAVRRDVEEQVRDEVRRPHRDLGLDPPGEPGPVHDDRHRPDRPGPDHRRHLPGPRARPEP